MFANLLLCKHGLQNEMSCFKCETVLVGQTEHCIKNMSRKHPFLSLFRALLPSLSQHLTEMTALQDRMWLFYC